MFYYTDFLNTFVIYKAFMGKIDWFQEDYSILLIVLLILLALFSYIIYCCIEFYFIELIQKVSNNRNVVLKQDFQKVVVFKTDIERLIKYWNNPLFLNVKTAKSLNMFWNYNKFLKVFPKNNSKIIKYENYIALIEIKTKEDLIEILKNITDFNKNKNKNNILLIFEISLAKANMIYDDNNKKIV